jgi:hypothetical protein
MPHTRLSRRGDGRAYRDAIHALEFHGFGRIRMRRADEMHERRAGRDRSRKGRFVERVADDRLGAGRKLPLGARTDEGVDTETFLQQRVDERPADVPGAAGDEDGIQRVNY